MIISKRKMLQIIIQKQLKNKNFFIPTKADFKKWIITALESVKYSDENVEVTIRIVDEAESAALNNKYRNKNYPTNILSFPSDIPVDFGLKILGDLVICGPIVMTESESQNKNLKNHWAHLTIHGTLHLLGYDHNTAKRARTMENLEIKILAKLGIENPY